MKPKWLGAFALLVIGIYGWAAGGANRGIATKEPQDYYGYLTDAFLAGQTYLKVAPDPALQNLANPWAGAQGIPRLHDASYFHGRYYIYFGPAPVLLLLLPWRVATGTFLVQGVATAIFGMVGTIIAGALLLWAWRRWFPDLQPVWLALGLLVLALGSRVVVLVEDASVYQVPITCAFFCLMAALAAATWAMAGSGGRRGAVGLGLASLAWGLAVASRPDYLFSLGALAIPLAHLWACDRRGPKPAPGRLFRLAACAIGPAALIGIGLAGYNYARFGNILEFGFKYQFTAGDQRFLSLFAPGSLVDNFRTYFLGRPPYSIYFPFLVSAESRGLLFCTPYLALAAAFPLTWWDRGWRSRTDWAAWGLTVSAALLLNLLSLAVLPIANERYFVDFVPAALLLSVVSAWALLSLLQRAPRLRRSVAQAALLSLAIWTIGQGVLMTLSSYADPSALRPLARAADRVVATLEAWRGTAYGPVKLRVRFPSQSGGRREPLLVSGHGSDILYVEYPSPGQVRIGFFHAGAGGPVSDPIPIIPGKAYDLRIDLGSLYPPKDHPLLSAWPEPMKDLLLRRLEITLDGGMVLQGAEAFYPTYPGDIRFGENPPGIFVSGKFTGELTDRVREGIPAQGSLRGPAGVGPVRLVVRFPPFQNFRREPLVSTGHALAGDLLYVIYVAPGVIRLGHDSWGGGAVQTAPLTYDPGQSQEIDADLASLRPMAEGHATGTLALRFNGRLVMFTRRPFNASPPTEVFFGFNGCDSSAAPATFSGQIIRTERISAIAAPAPLGTTQGPVQLVLRYPADRSGTNEPLLAIGQRGTGDLIYVRYLDNHRIALGYADRDGIGHLGRPIAIDYAATHAIEVSLGSFYPSETSGNWGSVPEIRRLQALETLYVKLDGQTALLADESAHAVDNRGIAIGTNSIGAAYCEPAFTGQLYLQQRRPVGEALPPDIQDGSGPVRLTLSFPTGRQGRNEPLLVTGRAGAGDAIYVHYVDDHHLSLGYDHWNAGGPLSAPLQVDYGETHLIEISMGSLYPAAADSRLLSTVSVKLDGKTVILESQTAYPATAREITAGANRIGASSCEAAFTGFIVDEKRR